MDFSKLPENVLDMVKEDVFRYEQCSLKDLSNLALVSKVVNNDVKPWIYTEDDIRFFTLTCKCQRKLQTSDAVYLCKPFSDKKGYSYDWRCYHCTISSKLNKGKGLGKGGIKIRCFGVVDMYDPTFRTCNAVVKKRERCFKFCNSTKCNGNHNVEFLQ
jgi:hypothetical protein